MSGAAELRGVAPTARGRRWRLIAVALAGTLAWAGSPMAIAQNAGSADPAGSATDLAGSGTTPDPGGGSGSAAGSGDPAGGGSTGGTANGSSGAAGGSATGGGSAGGGTAGAGSATGGGTGSASRGSGAGPKVIQLPDDLAAPEVNASASPTAMKLGDRFTVFITAAYGDGVEVNLREPVDLGSSFEIKKKVSEDRTRADGKHVREWQLDVIAWELGELRVPPIAVTFTVNGRAGQVETNVLNLRVDGVLGDVVDDPKAMRDAHPPTRLTSRDWFWLWIGAGIATAVVVVIGVLLTRRSRRRRTRRLSGGTVVVPRRIDMTSERALERLLAIQGSGVLAREEDRKSGYAEMVDVIRDYVGARYRIATHDLTSSELLRRLVRVAPSEERALIEAWLERCDVVKYGGARPTGGEAQRVLDDARALVVATTQIHAAAKPVAREAA